jgi:hypothetical protein
LRRAPEPQEFLERLIPGLRITNVASAPYYHRRCPATWTGAICDAQFFAVVTTGQETAYQLGILAVARLAGYPEAKLWKMAEYLVDTLRNSFNGRLFSQEHQRRGCD